MKPSISLLPKVEDSHVEELVDLTLAITTINAHNRLAVAFRRVPGS
jgi:alkylhydroperoxidase family enzyme